MARAIKEECEGELAVAMPILEDALAALDTIKEADITYIRKLGNPPAAIKLVMEVCHFVCGYTSCCCTVLHMLASMSSHSLLRQATSAGDLLYMCHRECRMG